MIEFFAGCLAIAFRWLSTMTRPPKPDRTRIPLAYSPSPINSLPGQALDLPEAMDYLDSLFEAISPFVDGGTPLVWRGDVTDQAAELAVFEGVSEVLGGSEDGKEVYRGYILDLLGVSRTLEEPITADDEGITFTCAIDVCGMGGPVSSVYGLWRGIPVDIVFMSQPPADESARWLLRQDGSIVPKDETPDEPDWGKPNVDA